MEHTVAQRNGLQTETKMESAPGRSLVAEGEETLIALLRRRDEGAFREMVRRHHPGLLRLARLYVRTHDVAEEVVQDTWMGVLQGIDRFEGRSSVKSWIYSILINRAKTRGVKERRSIPFSALVDPGAEPENLTVEAERFLDDNHSQHPGHWAIPPRSWGATPEEHLLSGEGKQVLRRAIEGLSGAYREVLTLRDVDGLSAKEVCNILGITETNQRVLLHRARGKVRRAVETYFDRAQSR